MAAEKKYTEIPQLRNINQDPSMSGMFKYAFKAGENVIGKKQQGNEPAISLAGVGIAQR